jgi:hypothetical protein
MQWHCDQLTQLAQQPQGLVLGIFFAPRMVLLQNGKYAASNRTTEQVRSFYLQKLTESGLLR